MKIFAKTLLFASLLAFSFAQPSLAENGFNFSFGNGSYSTNDYNGRLTSYGIGFTGSNYLRYDRFNFDDKNLTGSLDALSMGTRTELFPKLRYGLQFGVVFNNLSFVDTGKKSSDSLGYMAHLEFGYNFFRGFEAIVGYQFINPLGASNVSVKTFIFGLGYMFF